MFVVASWGLPSERLGRRGRVKVRDQEEKQGARKKWVYPVILLYSLILSLLLSFLPSLLSPSSFSVSLFVFVYGDSTPIKTDTSHLERSKSQVSLDIPPPIWFGGENVGERPRVSVVPELGEALGLTAQCGSVTVQMNLEELRPLWSESCF